MRYRAATVAVDRFDSDRRPEGLSHQPASKMNYTISERGTSFAEGTPPDVIKILDDIMHIGRRVRLFFGSTGKPGDRGKLNDWFEENDVIGSVGRSTGSVKVPLLLHSRRSIGGGAILTQYVVRILMQRHYPAKGYVEVYRRDGFSAPDLWITALGPVGAATSWEVTDGSLGRPLATFTSEAKARRWRDFMLGKRMAK